MNLNSKTNNGEILYPTPLYTQDNDDKQSSAVQNALDEKKRHKDGEGYPGSFAAVSQNYIDSTLADMAGVRSRLQSYSNQRPEKEQVNRTFNETVKDVMLPKATPERRLKMYSQSERALEDALGGSFGEDMKQRLAARRQESKEQGEKAYREAVSVIGANPEFASYRAMEANDAVKDIEATITGTDASELVKRVAPLVKHGGYRMDEYVSERVLPKMYDTLLNEVVDEEKPKSSTEYVLRSSLANSLVGKVALLGRDAMLGNNNNTMLQDEGLKHYNASRLEQLSGSVGSLLVDAPVFSALGGLSGAVMGNTANRITSNLANRILARKFGEGMTRDVANDVAARVISNRLSFKMLQSSGAQGITLGNYDAMNSIVDDLLYQNDIDTGKAAGSFTKGLLTGTALGVVGTPLREASKGLSGAKKLFASSGVLSAESAVFTAGTELEKLKNDIEVTPIDLLQDFGESAATLLVMRMTHWRPKGASLKLGADGKLKEKFALSSSERAELKELNVNPEQFIEAVEKELKLPSFGGERSRYIKDAYSRIMSNEKLSASARAKLLFLVENKVTSTPPIPFDFTVKQREDSKWEVTTVDEAGRIVSRNIFNHAGNAKSHLMVHAAELRRNRIALFEMELTNGVRSANFIRQAGLYAKSNGKNIEEVATAVYKKSAGLEMTPAEQKIVDDILERTAYDEAGVVQMLYNVRRKIEKRHGLEKGTMFIDIHEPFYRLSNAKNNSLNEYEELLRDEVDRLKVGTDRHRSTRLLKQGLDSDYFGMSNDEVKAREIQDHYDWVAVRDADRVGLRSKPRPMGPLRPIYIPPEDNSGYVWSYGETKNTREDIERYRERAETIAAKFGVEPHFISDEREIERPDPEDYEAVVRYNTQIVSSGWVNMGRVFINLPNAKSVEDVEKTVLHEVVGHKGLMHVFGEHLNDFLEDVYRKASPEVLRGINRIKYQYRGFDNYTVMEEYLAYLAEGTGLTRQERSLYVRIKDYIRSLLIRMNIYTGSNRQISESELRDIMQRHCEYLQTKESPDDYRKDVFGSFNASYRDAKTYYDNALYRNELKSQIDKGEFLVSTPKFFRNAKELAHYDLLPPEQQKRVRERNGIVEEPAQNPVEENMYRRGKKTTSGERSGVIPGNSSSGGLLQVSNGHLSHYALTSQEDVANIAKNTDNSYFSARRKINEGGFYDIYTAEDAVRKLGESLKLRKSKSTQSFYGDLYEGDIDVDGKTLHLRISTHPATGDRMGNHPADDKISIVVYKNGEHVSRGEHNGYIEYIYDPVKVSLNDAANSILNGVVNLIENGTFVDYTGKAEKNQYPYYDDGKLHYRLPDEEKTTSGERSGVIPGNSSSEGLLQGSSGHLSRYSLATHEDVAKLISNNEITKSSVRKKINQGGFVNLKTIEDAVRKIGESLKLVKSKSSQSYYGDLYEGDFMVDGKTLHLRISTHPAIGDRMGNHSADDKISIVVYKNGEHVSRGEHNGYTEYIYDPNKVSLNDAANSILNGVVNLIENGTFVDYTGKAEKNQYPYYDDGKFHYRLPDDIYKGSGKEERQSLEREALDRGTAYDPTEGIPLLEDPFFRSLKANSPTYAYAYEHLRGLPLENWKAYDHDLWNTLVGMAEGGVERFVLKDIVTDRKFLEDYPELAMVPVGIRKELPMPVMYDKENNRILLDRRVYLYPQSRFYIDGALRSIAHDFEERRNSVKRQLDEFNSRFKKNYNDAVAYARKIARMHDIIPGFDADNSIAEIYRNEYGFTPDEFLTRFPDMDDYLLYRLARSMGSMFDRRNTPEQRNDKEKMLGNKIGKHRKFFWGPVEIIMDAAGSSRDEGPLRVATKKDHELHGAPRSSLDKAENSAFFIKYSPEILKYQNIFDPVIKRDPTGWEEYKRIRDAKQKAERERLGLDEDKRKVEDEEREREKRWLEMN